jgi:hypothetical protein
MTGKDFRQASMNRSIKITKVSRLLLVCVSLFVANFGVVHGEVAETRQTEVIVLSTLHQLHGETEGYSYEDLSNLIERLNPDVLAVELTTKDLESRRDQSVKQEYQESVFPLLEKHNYIVVPLEPSPPLLGELGVLGGEFLLHA